MTVINIFIILGSQGAQWNFFGKIFKRNQRKSTCLHADSIKNILAVLIIPALITPLAKMNKYKGLILLKDLYTKYGQNWRLQEALEVHTPWKEIPFVCKGLFRTKKLNLISKIVLMMKGKDR